MDFAGVAEEWLRTSLDLLNLVHAHLPKFTCCTARSTAWYVLSSTAAYTVRYSYSAQRMQQYHDDARQCATGRNRIERYATPQRGHSA